MEQDRARVLKLADGGSATGEQFFADSPYQHPDIIRALFWAVRAGRPSVREAGRATAREYSDQRRQALVGR
jgi:hypothetical protein